MIATAVRCPNRGGAHGMCFSSYKATAVVGLRVTTIKISRVDEALAPALFLEGQSRSGHGGLGLGPPLFPQGQSKPGHRGPNLGLSLDLKTSRAKLS
ncbi:hypothetical protein AMTR_s00053p00132280 [Amborella trichopoda]|uniref:Uncharacterized protein n=1 Tax=Amborella trichopoda TaxID=13333 RepID=W1PAW0_AMBTC|nr:hypothetical protein AMTR_s00053p00132280 [Amborella trichopoda]